MINFIRKIIISLKQTEEDGERFVPGECSQFKWKSLTQSSWPFVDLEIRKRV